MNSEKFAEITARCQPHPVFSSDWTHYYSDDFADSLLPEAGIVKGKHLRFYYGAEIVPLNGAFPQRFLYLSPNSTPLALTFFSFPKGVKACEKWPMVQPDDNELCAFFETDKMLSFIGKMIKIDMTPQSQIVTRGVLVTAVTPILSEPAGNNKRANPENPHVFIRIDFRITNTVAFSFIEELILEILKENVETKLLTRGTATRMARKMAKKWGSIYLDNATFCAFREFIKKFISVSCKDFFIYSPLKTIDDEFVKKTFPIHEK